jgi:D-alanyl-lipoteichoic acid acyltransferase DltB (MBOAT superfamily)
MLFNSYVFLLIFLPCAVLGYRWLGAVRGGLAAMFLAFMSLVYYASWNANPDGSWTPWPLALILGSITGNYLIAQGLIRLRGNDGAQKLLLGTAIAANVALIGWFKYSLFFARLAMDAGMGPITLPDVILPLGISFYTFQKIAFLIDVRQGKVSEISFRDYFLFVMFFPQLVAGPIVHHAEMMPQFRRHPRARSADFAVGLTMLVIGLFKKVVIADMLARDASKFFDFAAVTHRELAFVEGWCAAFLYALQLYFDFSGYSDMAIGAARLFGVRIPENFASPYKAASIIDFWRRWHITLSRFLRDYLYIALGGNRSGWLGRHGNLFVTMLLGGLWHGAGLSFILWGGAHGLLLIINHTWNSLRKRFALAALPKPIAVTITLLAVVALWVPFRAGTIELSNPAGAMKAVQNIWGAMFGFHGFDSWPSSGERVTGLSKALRWVPVLIVALWFPNTQQFLSRYIPTFGWAIPSDKPTGPRRRWQWRPTRLWLAFTLVLLIVVGFEFNKVSEFIYFQF